MDFSKFTRVTANSKDVVPGSLFIAIKGAKFNGEDYIPEAIANGAEAVVVDIDSKAQFDNVIRVENPRKTLVKAAKYFFLEEPKYIAAVTGTSGKTSTVGFFRQLAELSGFKSASMGTMGVVSNYLSYPFIDLNTPDPLTLHMLLNQMSMKKISHLAFETSSHGLDQNRADAVNIKAAGFTNFTREHLDYHGTMQEYFIAKARLFSELVKEVAVLNADISEYQSLLAICKRRKLKVFSYGKEGKDISLVEGGINVFGQSVKISNPVFSSFQRYNIMCAVGLAYACDIPLHSIAENIENVSAIQGRLESVAEYNGAQIIVDYAHKPDALEKVMQFLKEGCKGRLIVVFGCGGDRDQGRRPIMGEIATRLGDIVIITDDNPRSENPAQIRAEILASAPNAIEVEDRGNAISAAVELLQEGDILLIAGKGHEEYQIIGNQKSHFSDKEEVLKIIR